ncbi:MAG TPA: prolyl oligopeptidase family serine peptidase [Usitatibacter sp.]|jgi:prolyl oligopeptidase|nr:prolyl oligopeptidase family serine peptidase [Usitatibacter sp.]
MNRGLPHAALLTVLALTTASMAILSHAAPPPATDDPYAWLEDVTGEKPLAWVKERDAESRKELESKPGFEALRERLTAIYNSRERIPYPAKRGRFLYNFWQDEAHPRGIWRRTTLEEYRKPEPAWEVVLDIGKLSDEENVKWVWKGADCLFPDYRRCLVSLSRGGADAVEVREFDAVDKRFVKDGFFSPESKQDVAWRDKDTIYVARDFGAGSLTTSGYPRVVKEWRRGTPLEHARTVHEGEVADVGSTPWVVHEPGRRYEGIHRAITFYESEDFLREDEHWIRLEKPRDATLGVAHGFLFVKLRTAWKPADREFPGGSLLAIDLDRFLSGGREFEAIFEPSERVALHGYSVTRHGLLLDILDHVNGRAMEVRRDGSRWVSREIAVPKASAVNAWPLDTDTSDDYWMTVAGFIQPTTLYLAKPGGERQALKSLPAFFDAKGLAVTQHEAVSKDGTRVPYYVVMREGLKADGTTPTVLYGYGGFEIPMTPSYSGTIGAGWLEHGGAFVLANIRGGGEFGPEWHHAAQREGHQRSFDDFIAVAEDLVKRGVTSPRHLGIMGGSNGGLLVGATFVQRPDLFRAVVCQVPLLDMKRYSHLLAGASWIGEYGDPDKPEDWAFISKYSPYQNVKEGVKYPRVLFTTTTRDDRVHPGHARKMVAKMKAQGHDVLYFEDVEGGHGAGSTPAQQAYMWTLTYTFLRSELQ